MSAAPRHGSNLPPVRRRDLLSLAVMVIGLIIAATMLIPSLAQLDQGAPDRCPAAEARK